MITLPSLLCIAYPLCVLICLLWIKSNTRLYEAEERNEQLLSLLALYSEDNLVMMGEIATLLCKNNALSNMSCVVSPMLDKHGSAYMNITIHDNYSSVNRHFRDLTDTVNFLYSRAGL